MLAGSMIEMMRGSRTRLERVVAARERGLGSESPAPELGHEAVAHFNLVDLVDGLRGETADPGESIVLKPFDRKRIPILDHSGREDLVQFLASLLTVEQPKTEPHRLRVGVERGERVQVIARERT